MTGENRELFSFDEDIDRREVPAWLALRTYPG